MRAKETKRLALRRFSKEDYKDLHEYLSDSEVVKYEPYEPFTIEESKGAAEQRANSNDFFAVCLLEENRKMIGNIYFSKLEPSERETYEIGYVFGKNYWGKGYASEAVKCIITYAFEELGAHRIIAECNPKNTPSWKLLERVGMRRESELKKNIFFFRDENEKPIWQDTYQYAILREEYKR